MGLRFCNEAIMSLHQIWPRLEEPSRESLSPLQVSMQQNVQGIGAVDSRPEQHWSKTELLKKLSLPVSVCVLLLLCS